MDFTFGFTLPNQMLVGIFLVGIVLAVRIYSWLNKTGGSGK